MDTIIRQLDEALEKLEHLELELTASGIEQIELIGRVQKQEDKIKQLNDEKQEIIKELHSCQERIYVLEDQLNKWDATSDMLAENLVLIHENEELKVENETLQANQYALDENQVLTEENTKLKEENDNLQKENDSLQEKNVNLQEENSNLQNESKKAKEENNLLLSQNEQLENHLQTLEKEMVKLCEKETIQKDEATHSEETAKWVEEPLLNQVSEQDNSIKAENAKPKNKAGHSRKSKKSEKETNASQQLYFDFMDI